MRSAREILDYLDESIRGQLAFRQALPPAALERALATLDRVRSFVLTDHKPGQPTLSPYGAYLLARGYGALSYCTKTYDRGRAGPEEDARVLDLLREFWAGYLASEQRPRRPTPPARG